MQKNAKPSLATTIYRSPFPPHRSARDTGSTEHISLRTPVHAEMKKSALTSALAGGPDTAAAAGAAQPKKVQLDPAAFPCLVFADEVDAGGGATGDDSRAAADAGFDMTSVQIVGSAPTNVLLHGTALVGESSHLFHALCHRAMPAAHRNCKGQPDPGTHLHLFVHSLGRLRAHAMGKARRQGGDARGSWDRGELCMRSVR